MNELKGLPSLNEDQLDKLEEDLRRAEEKVKEVNLDQILEDLLNKHRNQNALIQMYEDEIQSLRKEVENVENIANSLPDDCFKKVILEP